MPPVPRTPRVHNITFAAIDGHSNFLRALNRALMTIHTPGQPSGRMGRSSRGPPYLARCPGRTQRTRQRPEPIQVHGFPAEGPIMPQTVLRKSQKAVCGYTIRIAEEGTPALISDSGYHSCGPIPDRRNARSPEPEYPSSDSDRGDSRLEGEQYPSNEVDLYPFSSSGDSEPVYLRAMRITATSALNKIESRAAKASKPTLAKVPNAEGNIARYKIGNGPQPQRDTRL